MKFDIDSFKKIRQEKRWSLTALAKKLNVTRVTMSRWENGKQPLIEKRIRELAEILEVPTSSISDLKDKFGSSRELSQVTGAFLSIMKTDYKARLERHNDFIQLLQEQYEEIEKASVIINAILVSMDVIFYIKDTNSKYIIASNAFLNNTGLKSNYNALGREDSDFFSIKEAKNNYIEDLHVIETEKTLQKEDYIPGTRKKKWGIINKTPIKDRDGKIIGLIGSIIDITERKRQEEEKRLLNDVMVQVHGLVWAGYYIRKKKIWNNFRITYLNGAIEELFGVTKEEFIEKPRIWLDNAAKDQHDVIVKWLLLNEFPKNIEIKYNHPYGKQLWLEINIIRKDHLYFGSIRDITPKKRTNNA